MINDNKTIKSTTTSVWKGVRSNIKMSNGLHTFKFRVDSMGGNGHDGIMIGVCRSTFRRFYYQTQNAFLYYSLTVQLS